MAVYVNPETGNHEVWNSRPEGYFTPEEWAAEHPAPEQRLFKKLCKC